MKPKPVVFLNSHPIQYFAPLYKSISNEGTLDLEVLYCSDETIKGFKDKQFGVEIKWDIPLLNGYQYRFLKNRSLRPSIYKGFFGLFNPGVIPYLFKKEKSLVIVHGWAYTTNVLTIIWAKLTGHTVCLRAETPYNQELKKGKLKTGIKNIWLRFLFLFIDNFFFIGKQNKLFYQSLGVKGHQLFFTPYSVDNKRFQEASNTINKATARNKTQLPTNKKVILFSGKYIDKKRPMDLLQAFEMMNDKDAYLVMVGDGELKAAMQQLIKEKGLEENVLLTGFINQSEIPFYYAAADFFVMCSGLGETWGLSVNEAMNFKLPIIESDMCGSSFDLVDEGVNGFVFETGNIVQLAGKLKTMSLLTEKQRADMGEASLAKVNQYSYAAIMDTLKNVARMNEL